MQAFLTKLPKRLGYAVVTVILTLFAAMNLFAVVFFLALWYRDSFM